MDSWIDPRTEPTRAVHLAPLVAWISRHWLDRTPMRILDLGCGDMLLARLLPGAPMVDGYDPSEHARQAARAALRRAGAAGEVFAAREAVPEGVYDGVVMSSVLQYLPDDAAVEDVLGDVARWLRSDRVAEAVATDVPLPGAGRSRDARDLVVGLSRELGPIGAIVGLARAAGRSPGALHSVAEADLAACSAHAGLHAVRLERNLSPFSARASYRFHR